MEEAFSLEGAELVGQRLGLESLLRLVVSFETFAFVVVGIEIVERARLPRARAVEVVAASVAAPLRFGCGFSPGFSLCSGPLNGFFLVPGGGRRGEARRQICLEAPVDVRETPAGFGIRAGVRGCDAPPRGRRGGEAVVVVAARIDGLGRDREQVDPVFPDDHPQRPQHHDQRVLSDQNGGGDRRGHQRVDHHQVPCGELQRGDQGVLVYLVDVTGVPSGVEAQPALMLALGHGDAVGERGEQGRGRRGGKVVGGGRAEERRRGIVVVGRKRLGVPSAAMAAVAVIASVHGDESVFFFFFSFSQKAGEERDSLSVRSSHSLSRGEDVRSIYENLDLDPPSFSSLVFSFQRTPQRDECNKRRNMKNDRKKARARLKLENGWTV